MLILNFNVSTAVRFSEVFSDSRSWTYKAYFSIPQEVPLIVPVDTEYHFKRPESSDTPPSPSVVGML